MESGHIDQVSSFAKMINDYGFLMVFGAVILLIAMTFLIIVIKRWDTTNKIRIESEREKSDAEICILQKQRDAEIKQTEKLFDFVTDIQTKQITEMRSLTEVINMIKGELQNNQVLASENLSTVNRIELSIRSLDEQNSDIFGTMKTILEYVKNAEEHNKEIIKHVNNILFYMEKNEVTQFLSNDK